MNTNQDIILFFNKASIDWDKNSINNKNAIYSIFNNFKDDINNKVILDIGCGTGVLVPYLVEFGAKKIVCMDISCKMLNIAKNKFKDQNKVSFICDDIFTTKLQLKFDTVIMYNVYPHLMDKTHLIQKIFYLLKHNGRFVVAHGMSKEKINTFHNKHACTISTKLLKAETEANRWKKYFYIDCLGDNMKTYYFSGTKSL